MINDPLVQETFNESRMPQWARQHLDALLSFREIRSTPHWCVGVDGLCDVLKPT